MEMIRTFIGLALPPTCQDQAQRLAADIASLTKVRLHPVRAGQAHVTGQTRPRVLWAGLGAGGEACLRP